MTGTIADVAELAPLAILIGYVRLQRGKEYPLSSKEGKRQMAIFVLLLLAMIAAGAYDTLSSESSKQEKFILLYIMFGGSIASLIGIGIITLRNRLARNMLEHSVDKPIESKRSK